MMSIHSIYILIALILVSGIVGLMVAIDTFKGMEDEE